uniref:Uncharacterized protein n=1 Tax=Ursus americanus TaxID=9643 RepID=A0A452RKY5_URSAM
CFPLRVPCLWNIFVLNFYSLCSPSLPALTEGYVGALHENRHGSSAQIRRRKASGDPYWAYSAPGGMLGLHSGVEYVLPIWLLIICHPTTLFI